MFKYLYRLITDIFDRCDHDWVLVKKGDLVDEFDEPIGEYRYWECRICKKKKQNEWGGY